MKVSGDDFVAPVGIEYLLHSYRVAQITGQKLPPGTSLELLGIVA